MTHDEKIRFLDNLDAAIKFHQTNPNAPSDVDYVITCSIKVMRNAFAKAVHMENYTKDLNPPVVKHGIDCAKMPHHAAAGYLHAPDDDSPYDVDGLNYCGRCHAAI